MSDPLAEEALLADLRGMWSVRDPAPAGLADDVLLAVAPELAAEFEPLELLDDPALLGTVRGPADARTLRFVAGETELLLRVGALPSGARRVDGWIVPPAPGRAWVVSGGEQREAGVDGGGRFAVAEVPSGSATVVLRVARSGAVRRFGTPAIEL